jgi:hypothetical protein
MSGISTRSGSRSTSSAMVVTCSSGEESTLRRMVSELAMRSLAALSRRIRLMRSFLDGSMARGSVLKLSNIAMSVRRRLASDADSSGRLCGHQKGV